MGNIVRCSNIIKQLNDHSQNGALFTSDVGLGNGVKTRSYCFCLNRLWAWMKGVSYDKNEVAMSINTAFRGLKLEHLQVTSEELNLFCRNLVQLNIKFNRGSEFKQEFGTVIAAVGTHILQGKPTMQVLPVSKLTPPKITRVRGRMDILKGAAARSDLRPIIEAEKRQRAMELDILLSVNEEDS